MLDLGHGTGSFSFETAEAMLAAGVMPDVISSDIHQMAIQGPMFEDIEVFKRVGGRQIWAGRPDVVLTGPVDWGRLLDVA